MKRKASSPGEGRACQYCGTIKAARGLAQHEKACKRKADEEAQNEAFFKAMEEAKPGKKKHVKRAQGNQPIPVAQRLSTPSPTTEPLDRDLAPDIGTYSDFITTSAGCSSSSPSPVEPEASAGTGTQASGDPFVQTREDPPQSLDLESKATALGITTQEAEALTEGDIKIEYHPNSGKLYEILPFHEYLEKTRARKYDIPPKPWRGFQNRDDFELAEFALEASLNQGLTERLLKIIDRVRTGESELTIRSFRDLNDAWTAAEQFGRQFSQETVTAPYKREDREFQVYTCDLWEHVLKQIRDPVLAPHFHYDAIRLYRFNGSRFVRFVTETYTANDMWEIQSSMPPGTKPIVLNMYADKAKLSTFGTQKGYPWMVSFGNLDDYIKTGKGVGSASIVGFLPVVGKDPAEEKKPGWADFKNVVWHKSADKVLHTLFEKARTGHQTMCGDQEERNIAPAIVIVSADYEEQCVMTGNRGVKGKAPCPTCLVPKQDLWRMDQVHSSRNSSQVVDILNSNIGITDKRKKLKKLGLRLIENVFWKMPRCDPYRAVSFDRLHAYHGGLFGRHLFDMWRKILGGMSRQARVAVDALVSGFPRWSNMEHFKTITDSTFNDGSDYECISKMIVLVSHHVLKESTSKIGYQLLKCMRRYQVLDMYMSFDLHTEDTLAELSAALNQWEEELTRYMRLDENKSWDFIKAHSHKHAVQDIWRKGVIRCMSTMPYEKKHGPIRVIYRRQTNFKNVEIQILKVVARSLVAQSIREMISILDSDETDAQNVDLVVNYKFNNAYLGSRYSTTFADIEEDHANDRAFHNFRINFNKAINGILAIFNVERPSGTPQIRFTPQDAVQACRYLRIEYDSQVNWKLTEDRLRCNPMFQGEPRYDAVIFNTGDGIAFAKLVYLFVCEVKGVQSFGIALIQALDAPIGMQGRGKERDLGLYRLRARKRIECEFIPVDSIVRGAVVVENPDAELQNEYYLMDTLDADMFLRTRGLFSARFS